MEKGTISNWKKKLREGKGKPLPDLKRRPVKRKGGTNSIGLKKRLLYRKCNLAALRGVRGTPAPQD